MNAEEQGFADRLGGGAVVQIDRQTKFGFASGIAAEFYVGDVLHRQGFRFPKNGDAEVGFAALQEAVNKVRAERAPDPS